MNKQSAIEVFKYAQGNLPTKMEDLIPISFVGDTAVKFYKEKLSLMDKLETAEEQRAATLKDGQEAGELLLEIEARIGTLYTAAPKTKAGGRGITGEGPLNNVQNGTMFKTKRAIQKNVSEKAKTTVDNARLRLNQAAKIAQHPEVVERVKAQAKEAGDIPTKTAVINQINYEKEKARRKAAEASRKTTQLERNIEVAKYLNILDKILLIMPAEPPKNWDEQAFKEAQAKAAIIIKRLEVFTKNHITEGGTNYVEPHTTAGTGRITK